MRYTEVQPDGKVKTKKLKNLNLRDFLKSHWRKGGDLHWDVEDDEILGAEPEYEYWITNLGPPKKRHLFKWWGSIR